MPDVLKRAGEGGAARFLSLFKIDPDYGQGIDIFDKDAFKKLQVLEETHRIERELKQRMTDRSAKAFFKEFNKMVDTADVVIQVRPQNSKGYNLHVCSNIKTCVKS